MHSYIELESIMLQDADLSQLRVTLHTISDEMGPGMGAAIASTFKLWMQSNVVPVDAIQIVVSDALIYRVQLIFPIIRSVESAFLKLESTNLKTTLQALFHLRLCFLSSFAQ